MKKINQTILHDPDNGKVGNCLQACIASILEMRIEDVPHFAEHHGAVWFDRMNEWFRKRGYWVFYVPSDFGFIPYGYSIINGVSPRGVRHSCVALDGKLVHDPHPSNDGLVEPDSYYLFVATLEKPSND